MHEKASELYLHANKRIKRTKKSNNEIKSNSNNKLNINTEHQERLGRVNILITF